MCSRNDDPTQITEDPTPCPLPGCIIEGLNDPAEMQVHLKAHYEVGDAIPGSCGHSAPEGMTAQEWHARESVRRLTRIPLTDDQKEAFRAYMHGLNRQAAIAQGVDPETICPRCGDDKAPDAKWCPSCLDWQQRWDETPVDQEC